MDINQLITYLGYFFLLLNTLAFILSYHKEDKALEYFILYLILCLFIQIFANFLGDLKQNNLFLSHVFFIGQFVFLSLFFSTIFSFKKLHRFLTFIVAFSFVLFLFIFPETLFKWNVLEIATTSVPLIIYSLYFFIKNIDDVKSNKYVYFNTGFFLYTLSSTLIFTLGNIESKELKLYVWNFNIILYLAFQILIFIEWYQNFRKPI